MSAGVASEGPPVKGPTEQQDLVRRLLGRHTREEWVDLLAVPFALLVICIVLAIIAPEFLTANNLKDVLVQAAVLAIVAFGMTFVIIAASSTSRSAPASRWPAWSPPWSCATRSR